MRIETIFLSVIGFFLTMTSTAAAHKQQQKTIVLLDTQGQDAHYYHTLVTMLQSLNVTVEYKNLYSMLEDPVIPPTVDGVIIMPGIAFMRNIKHAFTTPILEALHDYGKHPGKIIMLLMPTPQQSDSLINLTHTILSITNIFAGMPQEPRHALEQSLRGVVKNLLQADAQQGKHHGTTLINPQTSGSKNSPMPTVEEPLQLLPNTPTTTEGLAQKPYALTIKNPTTNTRYVVGRMSDFTYADPEENFFKNPFDITQRDALLEQSYRILATIFAHPSEKPHRPLPATLTSEWNKLQKQKQSRNRAPYYAWTQPHGISCAWLGLDDFFAADYDTKNLSATRQQEIKSSCMANGLSFVHDAQFNLLWIEFIPEWYLVNHGYRHNKRQEFINRVTTLALELKKRFASTPMPKIVVGTNLTSNFREQQPKNRLVDIYGHEYPNIPSPLDMEQFWQQELLQPLKEFVTLFSAILPINGVFLDFEMYHAQDQLAHYSSIHDFSNLAWESFAQHQKNLTLKKITDHHERINYLAQTKNFNNYFAALTKHAKTIGLTLKKEIRTIIPQAIIGGYGMTAPSSWFYYGLLSGLSTKQEPVIFASFNTDFYSHTKQLQQRGVHLLHGGVLMLSKLHQPHDFEQINQLRSYHDFVWYNRASRMAYGLTHQEMMPQYWNLEASPLEPSTVAHGIAKAMSS